MMSLHCGPSAVIWPSVSMTERNSVASASPASPDQRPARLPRSSIATASSAAPVFSAHSDKRQGCGQAAPAPVMAHQRASQRLGRSGDASGKVAGLLDCCVVDPAAPFRQMLLSRLRAGAAWSRRASSSEISALPVPPRSAISSSVSAAEFMHIGGQAEARQRMLEQGGDRHRIAGPQRGFEKQAASGCPGRVAESGVPAESSASMPKRRSSAATRRARSRSGVISAAWLSLAAVRAQAAVRWRSPLLPRARWRFRSAPRRRRPSASRLRIDARAECRSSRSVAWTGRRACDIDFARR